MPISANIFYNILKMDNHKMNEELKTLIKDTHKESTQVMNVLNDTFQSDLNNAPTISKDNLKKDNLAVITQNLSDLSQKVQSVDFNGLEIDDKALSKKNEQTLINESPKQINKV